MTTWRKISIVTPSFNQASYLAATIESIVSQGYPNLEYIVIDGGSSDGSVDIIREYEKHLAYWCSEKDNGQADAVAKGFRISTGQILGFLNSDDLLVEGALHKVAEYFQDDPALDILIGAGGMLDKDGRFLYGTYPLGWSPRLLLSLESRFMQPAVFFSRRAYESVGGICPDFRFCLDLDLFIRLAVGGFKHKVIHDRLALTRLHGASKTTKWQRVARREQQRIFAAHGYQPGGPTRRLMSLSRRIEHFLLRCRHEGVGNTLSCRSRHALANAERT